ncbi:MAG: hypothetical protein JWP29_2792, partial [Rhodoferax sp.]|nr:hypothetical protein [Rhodoferax sp.]
QLQAVSSVLAGMRYDLMAGDDDTGKQPLRLKTLTDALPGVRAIYAVDRNGLVIDAEQKSYIGRDAHERPYFTEPRDKHDDSLVFVSPPYLSILGNYVVNISKSMTAPDGGFAGITTAVLDQSYFEILAR